MPSSSPAINSFNAGEFSPLMMGQTDFNKWKSGCKKMLNFIPRSQGPAERRGGTYFVSEVKNSADRVWLARFEYNTTQAFILEFGPGYVRFYEDYGVALNGSGSRLEISSPFTADDLTNQDGGFGLSMVQSADVIYICSHTGNKPPYKLSRISNTNWTLDAFNTGKALGPYGAVNSDKSIVIYTNQYRIWSADGANLPDGTPTTTSLCTITANTGIFKSSDVGSLFYIESSTDQTDNTTVGFGGRIQAWQPQTDFPLGRFVRSDGKYYEAVNTGTSGTTQPTWTSGIHADGDNAIAWRYSNGGWGSVLITEFVSTTVVRGKIIQDLTPSVSSAVGKTFKYAFSDWSNTVGYPTKVSFYKNRLVFAGRGKLWFSVASDYENFVPMSDGFEVQSDDAINVQIESDATNAIRWMAPGNSLLIGTAGAEHSCSPSTTTAAFGPANIQITTESYYGSREISPEKVGSDSILVQRAGRKLRTASSDISSGQYTSTDLSVIAEHLATSSIISMAWQQEPDYVLWACLSNGRLLGLTYNKEQSVIGWHQHDVGGAVEAIASIPSPDGGRDDLWMIVRRTINGTQKRYIEYLHAGWDAYTESISSAFYVDCGLSYSGSAVTTLSGLSHLEGKTVAVMTDGAAHPDRVVSSGSISLEWPTTVAHVGLPFTSELITLPLEVSTGSGTAQSKLKRVNEAAIRFVNTLGGKMGVEGGRYLDAIPSRDFNDLMDNAPGPFTDDRKLVLPPQYDTNACLRIVQDQPLPMTVCAIYPRLWTSGE